MVGNSTNEKWIKYIYIMFDKQMISAQNCYFFQNHTLVRVILSKFLHWLDFLREYLNKGFFYDDKNF